MKCVCIFIGFMLGAIALAFPVGLLLGRDATISMVSISPLVGIAMVVTFLKRRKSSAADDAITDMEDET